ncbi:hypothetical protein BDR03DRAFT_963388 [Suillus americanus]|nr:hypothetical protein BDR03DRAFT_963388 [Suillus americanus]
MTLCAASRMSCSHFSRMMSPGHLLIHVSKTSTMASVSGPRSTSFRPLTRSPNLTSNSWLTAPASPMSIVHSASGLKSENFYLDSIAGGTGMSVGSALRHCRSSTS